MECKECNQLFHERCSKLNAALFTAVKDGHVSWNCFCCKQKPNPPEKPNKSKTQTPSTQKHDKFWQNDIDEDQDEEDLDDLESACENAGNSIDDVMKLLKKVLNSQQFLSDKFDSFQTTVNDLVEKQEALSTNVKAINEDLSGLELRVHALEQQLLSRNVEIAGLPAEEKFDPTEVTSKIFSAIECADLIQDITEIRVTKKPSEANKKIPLTLTVEMKTKAGKDSILKASKQFRNAPVANEDELCQNVQGTGETKTGNHRKSHRQKYRDLTSDMIGLNNNDKIHIREQLTPYSKQLLWLAKTTKLSLGYQYAWTKNGIVYLKKNENEKPIIIRKPSDIPVDPKARKTQKAAETPGNQKKPSSK